MANNVDLFAEKNVSSFSGIEKYQCIGKKNLSFNSVVHEFVINELVELTMLWTTGPLYKKYLVWYALMISKYFVPVLFLVGIKWLQLLLCL